MSDSSSDEDDGPRRYGGRKLRQTRGTKRNKALEEMRQLKKHGMKRSEQFELDDDDGLYDVVNDEEYAEIVRKRREQGDFVVDDDGTGYMDDGEEHFWDPNQSDEDGKKEAVGKRRLSGSPGDGKSRKKKKKKIKEFDRKNQKISKMFVNIANSKASTSHKESAKAKELEAKVEASLNDDSLENMLSTLVSKKKRTPAPAKSQRKKAKSSMKRRRVPAPAYQNAAARQDPTETVEDEEVDVAEPMNDFEPAADENEQPQGEEVKEPEKTDAGDKPAAKEEDENAKAEEQEAQPVQKLDAKSRLLAGAKSKPIRKKAVSVTPVKLAEETSFMATPPIGDAKSNVWNHSSAYGTMTPPQIAKTSGTKATVPNKLPMQTRKTESGETQSYFRMFWMDLYEDQYNIPGKVFLLGKVWCEEQNEYMSCCVEVCNLERVLYFLPRETNSKTGAKVELVDVHQEVKDILNKNLRKEKGRTYRMKMVKRDYAFELPDVPREPHDYLKVKYPLGAEVNGPLSQDLQGDTFSRVFGTRQSGTERMIIGRDLMGPCWLEINSPQASQRNRSWCKFMTVLDDPKLVCKLPIGENVPPPPKLKVLSLSLKTVVNKVSHAHEIVMISGMLRSDVSLEGETKDTGSTAKLKYFTAIRAPGANRGHSALPLDFKNKVSSDSKLSTCISVQANESALLSFFTAQLIRLDPDVIVGHNVAGFDLDVLLSRMQANKVRNWSLLGRLRRDKIPKARANGGGQEKHFGTLTPGRMLLDTYLTARELLYGQRSYSLTELSRTQLSEQRREIDPQDVDLYYQSSDHLFTLIRCNETDAWLTLQLMFKLEAVPLTLQLTNLGGNLWQRTLSGGRAERIEYLLLHEFHRRKYIVPDKRVNSKRSKDGKSKTRKKAAYTGGLVLEPKKGLYDTYILLLDFNSLYPSIIQEYNICYTTVERAVPVEGEDGAPGEEEVPEIPDRSKHPDLAILPSLIRTLVERRKVVKRMIKQEANEAKKKQLDVRQKALKITANSMYGCLGFSASRFFARPVAALVTSQGREILQNTVDTVEKKGLDVVYGDTDSIMINTNTTDLKKVKEIGQMVKKEINNLYKLLEIEQDGVFKTMLLLKKKKYAALLIKETVGPNGEKMISTEKEVKGLDLVRRDWAQLSKKTGHKVLNYILSGKPCEEVVEGIHETLEKLAKQMRANELPLQEYVITKGLNKSPKDYPDAKGQPHLQVALAMIKRGKPVNTGDHIPYVICKMTRKEFEAQDKNGKPAESGKDSKSKSYAQFAFHPDEVERSNGKLQVDIEWYLTQQIMPPIQRLCEPIAGTSPAQLAECLGLDSAKYNRQGVYEQEEDDEDFVKITKIDDAERYKACERVSMTCESCKLEFNFPGPFSRAGDRGDASEKPGLLCGTNCPKCENPVDLSILNNKLLLASRKAVEKYYEGWLVGDDPSAELRTRQQSVRGKSWSMNGRRIQLQQEYPSRALYEQLKYIESLVNVERAEDGIAKENERLEEIKQPQLDKPVIPADTRQVMDSIKESIEDIYTKDSGYAFIRPGLFKLAFKV